MNVIKDTRREVRVYQNAIRSKVTFGGSTNDVRLDGLNNGPNLCILEVRSGGSKRERVLGVCTLYDGHWEGEISLFKSPLTI